MKEINNILKLISELIKEIDSTKEFTFDKSMSMAEKLLAAESKYIFAGQEVSNSIASALSSIVTKIKVKD